MTQERKWLINFWKNSTMSKKVKMKKDVSELYGMSIDSTNQTTTNDVVGNVLYKGARVIFTNANTESFSFGTIEKINPKTIRISTDEGIIVKQHDEILLEI